MTIECLTPLIIMSMSYIHINILLNRFAINPALEREEYYGN